MCSVVLLVVPVSTPLALAAMAFALGGCRRREGWTWIVSTGLRVRRAPAFVAPSAYRLVPGGAMLPTNLLMLDDLVVEVRRLSMVEPPGRMELNAVLEQIAVLRNTAQRGGSVDLSAQLSAVASCVRAATHDPLRARDPLLEAWIHLTDLARSYLIIE